MYKLLTNNIFYSFLIFLSPFIFGGLFTSCNFIHADDYDLCDEPDSPTEEDIPVLINLLFDTDLPLYKEVTYTKADNDYTLRSPQYNDNFVVRYIIRVFSGSRSRADVPYKSFVFTDYDLKNLDYSFFTELPDGDYQLFVFTDLIDNPNLLDKFYDTSDLSYISIINTGNNNSEHPGSTEERDCFRGSITQTVKNSSRRTASNTINIQMQRPVARFEFIATDYDRFIDSELQRAKSAEQNSRAQIDPDDYQILFQYDGFMPSAYSVYEDFPNDSQRYVIFKGKFTENEDGTASLGFDHVFVYTGESSLNLIMNILDKTGNLVSSTPSIEVPLYRSKNTIIKGEFLTSSGGGGVGIVPDYDGEYNVEFH